MDEHAPTSDSIDILDHGFVRLDDAMADDLSVVNGARVSFARRKTEMEASDEALIRFLMRDRHGSPFEHNAFRFHIRCPIFVAREWFRHRIGCLSGDTVVTFVNTEGHTTPGLTRTLDELWEMWSVGERDGHALSVSQRNEVERLLAEGQSQRSIARHLGIGRRAVRSHVAGAVGKRDARWRVRRMRLRVLDEETGEFTVGHVGEVIQKGIQPVYRLTLADGKELVLTENHRVLTTAGWMTMRAAVGLQGTGESITMSRSCRLMTNGATAYRDPAWLADRRREGKSVSEIALEAGCSYHTIRKWLRVHDLRFSPKERAHRSPRNQGRTGYHTSLVVSEKHRDAIRLPCARRYEHRIGFAVDGSTETRTGFRLIAHPVAVRSIAYVGRRQTYDLTVAGPRHNFVANGVVVHNSFNEFSLRYAKASDDFYLPELADVRTQVGKPGAYSFEPVDDTLAEHTREQLQAVYDHAYAVYEELVEAGVARELARSVLPVGAYTQFYWTVNARALMNFVSLRNSEFAQLEIRRYAEAVESLFAQRMPVTHASFVENGRLAP
jgi:thymidylate synthase ThyX/DNA-binding CsgD family transcriptional regulator